MAQPQITPLVDSIVQAMDERKATAISVLDLTDIENSVCDYFVICEGTSNTQIDGIAASIEEKVRKELNEKPWHVEGKDTSRWVLVDYVNTVAHIFLKETREFYDLESLWGDAPIIEVSPEHSKH